VVRGDDHLRDAILQKIEVKGLDGWKNESGYHRRSIAENRMYRLKQLGDSLYSQTFDRQVTEAHVRTAIINTFILHAAHFSVFENSWKFMVIKVCILLLKRVPRSRRQASMLSLKVANVS